MLPTDSSGKICGVDYPQFPYLYFPQAPLIHARICVSVCPTLSTLAVPCATNSVVTTCAMTNPHGALSDTVLQTTPYGDFCWPLDIVLKSSTETAAGVLPRQNFFQSIPSIWMTLIAVLVFSIIFLFLSYHIAQFLIYVIIPTVIVLLVFVTNLIKGLNTK